MRAGTHVQHSLRIGDCGKPDCPWEWMHGRLDSIDAFKDHPRTPVTRTITSTGWQPVQPTLDLSET